MHTITLPSRFLDRFRHNVRHPDQAAIAARLPVIGARVANRDYWRRQPVDPARMIRHGREEAAHALQRSRSMLGACAPAARGIARNPAALAVSCVAAGALSMYYFDPHQGRRRRALVRDRVAHVKNVFTRDLPRTAEKRGRFFRGVARGVTHDAVAVVTRNGSAPVDNETLVARVRSEALRDAGVKAGEIHVDAYEGCVTLRGQLEEAETIRRVVEAARRVHGVREVRNYLHLPGTPPPNKGDVYEHVPAHMAARD